MTLLHRIQHFITYHNAVPLLFATLFTGAAGAYAATVITPDSEDQRPVNTQLLSVADLDALHPQLQITSVNAVDGNHEVVYNYKTMDVLDGAWQHITREGTLIVKNSEEYTTAEALQTYINKELYEVIAQDRAVLHKVQQKIIATTETDNRFAALVGSFAVEKPETPIVVTASSVTNSTAPAGSASRITTSIGAVAVGDGSGNDDIEELLPNTNTEQEEEVVTVPAPVVPSPQIDLEPESDTAATTTQESTTATTTEEVSVPESTDETTVQEQVTVEDEVTEEQVQEEVAPEEEMASDEVVLEESEEIEDTTSVE